MSKRGQVTCFSQSVTASAQAVPTAAQSLHVSAFGWLTGTYTGIAGGRNVGITASVDLGIRPVFAFYPSLELRGTYPVATGSIDSQKNILGGINLARTYGRLHPYADLLFGRGQINYGAGRVTPDRTAYYIQSFSNVLSPGLGLDLDLSDHLAVKFDAQLALLIPGTRLRRHFPPVEECHFQNYSAYYFSDIWRNVVACRN